MDFDLALDEYIVDILSFRQYAIIKAPLKHVIYFSINLLNYRIGHAWLVPFERWNVQ